MNAGEKTWLFREMLLLVIIRMSIRILSLSYIFHHAIYCQNPRHLKAYDFLIEDA